MGGAGDRDAPHYTRPIVERAEVDAKNPAKLDWKPVERLKVSEATWDEVGEEVVDPKYLEPISTTVRAFGRGQLGRGG